MKFLKFLKFLIFFFNHKIYKNIKIFIENGLNKIGNYAKFLYEANFENILHENPSEKAENEEEDKRNDDNDNIEDAFQNIGTFLPQGLLEPDDLDLNDLPKH